MRFKKTVRAVYRGKHLLTSLKVEKGRMYPTGDVKLMMNRCRCILHAPFCTRWKLVSLNRKRNNRSEHKRRTRGAITLEIVIRREACCKNKSLTFMGGVVLSEMSLSLTSRLRMINNCWSRWLRISNHCTIFNLYKSFIIIFFGSRNYHNVKYISKIALNIG